MSCKSLLALPLVGALAWFVTGSAVADPWPPRAPVGPPACPPAPVRPPACPAMQAPPSVCPGELPEPEAPPDRYTMTIYNGGQVVQQNFVENYGSWRATGEFKDYDVFFRDSPRVPWRFYGTYYSARSAEDAAGLLKANGNLASVRPYRV
jgi:hypothetical protein